MGEPGYTVIARFPPLVQVVNGRAKIGPRPLLTNLLPQQTGKLRPARNRATAAPFPKQSRSRVGRLGVTVFFPGIFALSKISSLSTRLNSTYNLLLRLYNMRQVCLIITTTTPVGVMKMSP
jgi:hypothetical protein